jgi:hypothetical protein
MSVEMILVLGKALIWFAIPIGLGLWELYRLRRDRARDRARDGGRDGD